MQPIPPVEYPREGYELLVKALKETSGLDLSAYKERQTLRRLSGFLSRQGISDWPELARLVREDPGIRQQLTDHLAINVSEFFRNPERFEQLARDVLPELLAKERSVRIWSAGSSVGAEPYSLAMMLEELSPGSSDRHTILGTDIDREALAVARKAVFSEDLMKQVSDERRRRFFEARPDGTWEVRSSVRRYVTFREHNLLEDPYPTHQHLILCRNVIIYFVEDVKNAVVARFAESLAPGGYLLVGSTETIFRSETYGLRSVAPFLYQRLED